MVKVAYNNSVIYIKIKNNIKKSSNNLNLNNFQQIYTLIKQKITN